MSRQIGSLNHEELIGALVAITVQLFFLIPQKSLLAKIGGEGVNSCPLSFILFTYDWQIGLLNSNCMKRLTNISAIKHHVPDACGSGVSTLSWYTSSNLLLSFTFGYIEKQGVKFPKA